MSNHTRRAPITTEQIKEVRYVAQHILAQSEVEAREGRPRDSWRAKANRLARIVLALTHPVQLETTQ